MAIVSFVSFWMKVKNECHEISCECGSSIMSDIKTKRRDILNAHDAL